MLTLKRSTCFAICCSTSLLFGCAKTDDQAADTAGATAAAGAPAPIALSAADFTGKWDVRAVPLTGDTTPTTFVLTATADNSGWTITFPNRAPVATRVTFDGDSLMTDAGPFESVRRRGVQVRTNGVFRLQDGSLVGTNVAHYATKGADSVLTLRMTGTRAR